MAKLDGEPWPNLSSGSATGGSYAGLGLLQQSSSTSCQMSSGHMMDLGAPGAEPPLEPRGRVLGGVLK